MSFSKNIEEFLTNEFDGLTQEAIDSMSVEELENLQERISQKRDEYALIESAYKTCANAAYGASANAGYYFYNVNLASDITAECRALTKFFWNYLEEFLKEHIWNRKDIWEMCDFALDESKHDWIREQTITHQADTDSVYMSYEPLFECFTEEYKQKYATDEAKVRWILDFYKKFMGAEQRRCCDELYNSRNGHNVHEFELELICKSTISLVKKKYVKSVVYEKGHFMLDKPKLKSTGVEIVKSTTPTICRRFLKELVDDLLYAYDIHHQEEFIYLINDKLSKFYKEFRTAPIDDISQSVGVGDYKKYVICDTDRLELGLHCPFSVKAAARYNYLANKAGRSDLKLMSGKIKYYNIRVGKNEDYFGYPYGEWPSEFAPPVDYTVQWRKTVIDPINRFLEAMKIPTIGETNSIQLGLFGF